MSGLPAPGSIVGVDPPAFVPKAPSNADPDAPVRGDASVHRPDGDMNVVPDCSNR